MVIAVGYLTPAEPIGTPSSIEAVGSFDRKLENQQSGWVKTTLDLPNDLVREVKLRAVNEGKKLKDVISELLRQGLGCPVPTLPGVTARRGRITFRCFPRPQGHPSGGCLWMISWPPNMNP